LASGARIIISCTLIVCSTAAARYWSSCISYLRTNLAPPLPRKAERSCAADKLPGCDGPPSWDRLTSTPYWSPLFQWNNYFDMGKPTLHSVVLAFFMLSAYAKPTLKRLGKVN
jgi:hypothetical protein